MLHRILPTTFWLRAISLTFIVSCRPCVLLFHYWLLVFYIHAQCSGRLFLYILFRTSSQNSHIDRHQTVKSNSNHPSKDENIDNINRPEKNTESTQDQTSVGTNSDPTRRIQQNRMHIRNSSSSDIFTEGTQNPS